MPRRIAVDYEFKIDDAGRNPPRIRCMVAIEQRQRADLVDVGR